MGRRPKRIVRSRRQVEDEALDEGKRIDRFQHPVQPRWVGVRRELEKDRGQVVNGSAFPQQVAQVLPASEWTDAAGRVRTIEVECDVGGPPDKGDHGRG